MAYFLFSADARIVQNRARESNPSPACLRKATRARAKYRANRSETDAAWILYFRHHLSAPVLYYLCNPIRRNMVFSFSPCARSRIIEFCFGAGEEEKSIRGCFACGVQVVGRSVWGWGGLRCTEKEDKHVHISFWLAAFMSSWAFVPCEVRLLLTCLLYTRRLNNPSKSTVYTAQLSEFLPLTPSAQIIPQTEARNP